jgi:CRISPR-associated protein Cas1
MSTLILNRNSINVKLEANHLVLHEHADGGSFTRMPLVDIERVIIVGQPAITFPVLTKFLDLGIPCSFLTHAGRWRGMMDGDPGFHAGRRMRQYAKVQDDEFSLSLVRGTVAAKIANCRRTIQRLAAERKICLQSDEEWEALEKIKNEVSFFDTVNALRGIEGMAANVYFSLLGRFFPAEAPFQGRSRRPPRDAVNALMSFVYTLLVNAFAAVIRAHGLDVAAGFFHCGVDRSPALALDLVEPFRSTWGDRLVLDLLNHHRVSTDKHFVASETDGVYLNDEGRKIVFRSFDEMMDRKRMLDGHSVSRRQIVEKVVCRFVSAIEADEKIEFYKAA